MIASGGVTNLDDVRRLLSVQGDGVIGTIVFIFVLLLIPLLAVVVDATASVSA